MIPPLPIMTYIEFLDDETHLFDATMQTPQEYQISKRVSAESIVDRVRINDLSIELALDQHTTDYTQRQESIRKLELNSTENDMNTNHSLSSIESKHIIT